MILSRDGCRVKAYLRTGITHTIGVYSGLRCRCNMIETHETRGPVQRAMKVLTAFLC
jgi:hypothetical protein